MDRQEMPAPGRLGELLVARRLASRDDVEKAVAEQRHTPLLRLGEILVASGIVALSDMIGVLLDQYDARQRHSDLVHHHGPPLGEILVLRGAIDRATLEWALGQQRLDRSRKLGAILVEAGLVSVGDLIGALADQLRLRHAVLAGLVSASVLAAIPASAAATGTTDSASVTVSVTIPPRIAVEAAPQTAMLPSADSAIVVPEVVSLPGLHGGVATITATGAGRDGTFIMRNASGDTLPFGFDLMTSAGGSSVAITPDKPVTVDLRTQEAGTPQLIQVGLDPHQIERVTEGHYSGVVVLQIRLAD